MRLEPEDASFAAALIDQYYAENGLLKGWDRLRVRRLCHWLHCTMYELGRLFLVPKGMMKRFYKANKYPPYIALHFALVEQWYLEKRFHNPQMPIIPIHLLANSLGPEREPHHD